MTDTLSEDWEMSGIDVFISDYIRLIEAIYEDKFHNSIYQYKVEGISFLMHDRRMTGDLVND